MWRKKSGKVVPDVSLLHDDSKVNVRKEAGGDYDTSQKAMDAHPSPNIIDTGKNAELIHSDKAMQDMHVWKWLENAAISYGETIAGVQILESLDGPLTARTFSYAQMRYRAECLASFLWDRNLRCGSKIGVLSHNSYNIIEVHHAAAATQSTIVNLNSNLRSEELRFILDDSKLECLFVHESMREILKEAVCESSSVETSLEGPQQVENKLFLSCIIWISNRDFFPQIDIPENLCCQFTYVDCINYKTGTHMSTIKRCWGKDFEFQMYYTSGTTGKPKGVILLHSQICLHALGTIEEMNLSIEDIWGHIAPMFHLVDAFAMYAITYVCGRHVVVERFSPSLVLQVIGKMCIFLT